MDAQRDSDRALPVRQVGVGRRYEQVYQTWSCLPEASFLARTRLAQERMDSHGQEAIPSSASLLSADSECFSGPEQG